MIENELDQQAGRQLFASTGRRHVRLFKLVGTAVLLALAPLAMAPTASVSGTMAPTVSRVKADNSFGAIMPKGNLRGWHQVFADDFSRNTIGANWYTYSGQPGSDTSAWWEGSHVAISGGHLVIRASRELLPQGLTWVSGGISLNDRFAGTYGRYEIRMRADPGRGISAIALLWPTGAWPPEVDFYEDSPSSNARTSMSATLHYGVMDDQVQKTLRGVDFTKWHTLGLTWTRGRLSFSVDGRIWADITGSRVPAQPMNLAVQVQALQCTSTWNICPGRQTPKEVNADIAWVVVYRPAPVTDTATS